MKNFLLTLALFISISVVAQNDKIEMHNGKTVEGSVVRVTDFTIVYKYAGEDAEQSVGKYAVAKIVYGKSGREEKISDKIVVSSKDDWESVVLLIDKSEATGLVKADEIKGKTSMINYRSAANSDKKSQQRLKEEAAAMGCPFVLITSDKDPGSNGANSGGLGSTQSIKKGVAYKY